VVFRLRYDGGNFRDFSTHNQSAMPDSPIGPIVFPEIRIVAQAELIVFQPVDFRYRKAGQIYGRPENSGAWIQTP
jgi:hypothetical protein